MSTTQDSYKFPNELSDGPADAKLAAETALRKVNYNLLLGLIELRERRRLLLLLLLLLPVRAVVKHSII